MKFFSFIKSNFHFLSFFLSLIVDSATFEKESFTSYFFVTVAALAVFWWPQNGQFLPKSGKTLNSLEDYPAPWIIQCFTNDLTHGLSTFIVLN